MRHHVPTQEIETRNVTFLILLVYGFPVSFYNNYYDLLHSQQCLFARKISPDATGLKSCLTALHLSPKSDFPVSQEGLYLHNFATQQGRLSQQHGARLWEQQSTIVQSRELLIAIFQKWPVALRLVSRVKARTDINTLAYLFDDDTIILLRLVFDSNHDDRLLICLDLADFYLIKNFCAESAAA